MKVIAPSDGRYALHAIRISALRTADDPLTPRIVTLDPAFGLNPYITAMGLGDIDRWPEIKRALDSPPPEPPEPVSDGEWGMGRRNRGATGLRYTQTIMGNRSGGAGMRVSGRRVDAGEIARRLRAGDRRANSTSHDMRPPVPPRSSDRPRPDDPFMHPAPRHRSGSDPIAVATAPARDSIIPNQDDRQARFLPRSVSETSGDVDDDLITQEGDDGELGGLRVPSFAGTGGTLAYAGSSVGVAASALPSDLVTGVSQPLADPLAGEAVDEGSDVDEDEVDEDEPNAPPPIAPPLSSRPTKMGLRDSTGYPHTGARVSVIHEEDRRSSTDSAAEPLEFGRQPIGSLPATATPSTSALTAALNQHVPHLVSTGGGAHAPEGLSLSAGTNPFTSLYASVAAPSTVPSISLELFFPHSDEPSDPIMVSVRKDATVEEVTGYGLYKYWEMGREPRIEEPNGTVDWGLRIVEDDGEVDEDFPRG